MVAFLKERLQKLLQRNVTRVNLAEKLHDIINNYNNVSSDVEAFFKALKEYAERLREEEKRAVAEDLSEEELEIFDLLFKEQLNELDKKKVKTTAQALLQKLKDNETRRTVLTTDWYKNVQLQKTVKKMVGDILDKQLPESYDPTVFKEKQNAVYSHIYNLSARGREYWA